jgi:prevent-host-death family protein
MSPKRKKLLTYTTTDVQRKMSEVIEEVMRNDVVRVERRGRPVFYMVDARAFEQMQSRA